MINAREAYKSLMKVMANPKVSNCYLCDDGYIFVLDANSFSDNGFFVKSNGGVRPLIPERDMPRIIKRKEQREYLED